MKWGASKQVCILNSGQVWRKKTEKTVWNGQVNKFHKMTSASHADGLITQSFCLLITHISLSSTTEAFTTSIFPLLALSISSQVLCVVGANVSNDWFRKKDACFKCFSGFLSKFYNFSSLLEPKEPLCVCYHFTNSVIFFDSVRFAFNRWGGPLYKGLGTALLKWNVSQSYLTYILKHEPPHWLDFSPLSNQLYKNNSLLI